MAITLPKPLRQSEKGGPFRFTLEQFFELSDGGAFGDYRVELLGGEVFVMPRQGSRHAEAIRDFTELFVTRFLNKYRVSPQCPVVLTAPPPDYVEPDLALLQLGDYADREVTSEDVRLIVEVSDSTLQRDQGEKLHAYARNRVPEVWVLDLNANLLHVYRDPGGERYRKTEVLEPGTPAEFAGERLAWS